MDEFRISNFYIRGEKTELEKNDLLMFVNSTNNNYYGIYELVILRNYSNPFEADSKGNIIADTIMTRLRTKENTPYFHACYGDAKQFTELLSYIFNFSFEEINLHKNRFNKNIDIRFLDRRARAFVIKKIEKSPSTFYYTNSHIKDKEEKTKLEKNVLFCFLNDQATDEDKGNFYLRVFKSPTNTEEISDIYHNSKEMAPKRLFFGLNSICKAADVMALLGDLLNFTYEQVIVPAKSRARYSSVNITNIDPEIDLYGISISYSKPQEPGRYFIIKETDFLK